MKHLTDNNHTTAMRQIDASAAGISGHILRTGRNSGKLPVMSLRSCDGMTRFLMTMAALR